MKISTFFKLNMLMLKLKIVLVLKHEADAKVHV